MLARLVCSKMTEALTLEMPISKVKTTRTGDWGQCIFEG